MNWKCPVCGNPENLDESLRCICDHEIKAEEIEKYRVELGVIETYSKENKLGQGSREFNFWIRSLEVLSLLSYAIFGFFTSEKVAVIATPLCLFFLMTFVIIESIVKKQVSIKIYIIIKSEAPSAYNTFLFTFVVAGLAFFAKFVYALGK